MGRERKTFPWPNCNCVTSFTQGFKDQKLPCSSSSARKEEDGPSLSSAVSTCLSVCLPPYPWPWVLKAFILPLACLCSPEAIQHLLQAPQVSSWEQDSIKLGPGSFSLGTQQAETESIDQNESRWQMSPENYRQKRARRFLLAELPCGASTGACMLPLETLQGLWTEIGGMKVACLALWFPFLIEGQGEDFYSHYANSMLQRTRGGTFQPKEYWNYSINLVIFCRYLVEKNTHLGWKTRRFGIIWTP